MFLFLFRLLLALILLASLVVGGIAGFLVMLLIFGLIGFVIDGFDD